MDRIDWMIDIETDGLNAEINSITSIAVVEFQLGQLCDIDEVIKCHYTLTCPDDRAVDLKTLAWRKENDVDIMERNLSEVKYETFLAQLHDFLSHESTRTPHVWAKPTLFDFGFLTSYLNRYANGNIPWHHRHVHDVNSFIDGRGLDRNEVFARAEKDLSWHMPHNALYDCVFQIAMLKNCFN